MKNNIIICLLVIVSLAVILLFVIMSDYNRN